MPRLRWFFLVAVAIAATVGVTAGSAGATDVHQIRSFGSPLPLPPEVTRIAEEAREELSDEATRSDEREREALEATQIEAASVEPTSTLPTAAAPTPAAALDPAKADQVIVRADVLDNGIALPPLESPPEVRAIIEAGNGIARTPYLWGGGHGKWQDKGYDCSGSVSFALASAGLLDRSLTSGQLESWGEPGPGRWVTVWANDGHVFMEVAGVRFDTTGRRKTGSRWQNEGRPTAGFVARHPAGL